jgi:hypothetical protein
MLVGGEWRNRMENLFPKDIQEIGFVVFKDHKLNKVCDVNLSNRRTLELHNSYISGNEITKNMIWLIDGNTEDVSVDTLSTGTYLLHLTKECKFKSFAPSYEFVLVDIESKIFKIPVSDVKNGMIELKEWMPIERVVDVVNNEPKRIWDLWCEDNCIKSRLCVHQKGAGNGKTYGIWKSIAENKDKTTYIILTKQHSAKDVIYAELNDQAKRGEYHIENMREINIHKRNKHYVIKYTHVESNRSCVVIIGTIDSYIYNLTTCENSSTDFFNKMLEMIIKNGCNKVDKKTGGIQYAGEEVKLNKQTELWIDEAQDLNVNYLYALTKMMLQTGMEMHVVGDKLQSIVCERNLFTELYDSPHLPNIDVMINEPVNVNSRIKVDNMHTHINQLINFGKYNLPEISLGNIQIHQSPEESLEIFDAPVIYTNDTDTDKLSAFVDSILENVNHEVITNNYLPEDFMFIFPIMKSNELASELEIRLNDYWVNKFGDHEYVNGITDPFWKEYDHDEYTQYAFLHKHEEGTVINLTDSERASRLVTIRTAKGDGRNVVFVLRCTEDALRILSDHELNLKYESYLHVAITRAKRKVYFGLESNGDDICNRFGELLHAPKQLPYISKYVKLDTIIKNINMEQFIASLRLNENENIKGLFESVEKDSITKITSTSSVPNMDWKYYCIRRSVAYNYVLFNILEYVTNQPSHLSNKSQIKVVLDLLKPFNVVKYSPKDFYKYLRSHPPTTSIQHVPLCNRDNKDVYKQYSDDIYKEIKHIQANCDVKNARRFTVYNMFLMEYIVKLYMHKQYADIDPSTLYDITHYFKDPHSNDNRQSLDACKSIEDQCKACLSVISKQSRSHIRWNFEKSVTYNGYTEDDVCVSKKDFDFIGHDDKNVYHINFVTNLNGLNMWEQIISTLFERFLIYNSKSSDDNARYKGKVIKSYMMILSHDSYKLIDWRWDKELKPMIDDYLKSALRNHFGKYHEKLFHYLFYIKNGNINGIEKKRLFGKNMECKTPYKYIAKELSSQKNTPSYIIRFFQNMHDECSIKKKEVKELTDDVNMFCDTLAFMLDNACDSYLGLDNGEYDDNEVF